MVEVGVVVDDDNLVGAEFMAAGKVHLRGDEKVRIASAACDSRVSV